MTSYELTDSAEVFTAAIQPISDLTQAQGPRGILRYSFYANAGAIVVFRDPEAWLAQHEFVPSREEYKVLYQTVRIAGLRFFGNFSSEIRAWLDERDVAYEYAGALAAGFER